MFSLVTALQQNEQKAADRLAAFDSERSRLSWRETVHSIACAASVLAELGLREGDTFAIAARNSFCAFQLMHAGYWLGAIPVPINTRLAAPEIAQILGHSRSRIVFIDAALASAFEAGPLQRWRHRTVSLAGRSELLQADFAQAIREAPRLAPCEAQDNQTALLLYTGGTTGKAKGVPLSHRNIVGNALQVTSRLPFSQEDVYLHAALMFHSADLLGTAVTLLGGAHAFLEKFTPQDFLRAVASTRVTATMLAPAMVKSVLEATDVGDWDVSSLRLLFYGSSPMPVHAIRRAMERFPTTALTQGYGLTETSPLLTVLTMADHQEALEQGLEQRLTSAGRALPGVRIRITDRGGAALPQGEAGDVWVQGPNVTSGYWEAPLETAAAIRGGWFATGDVGRLDADGFLTLLDRSKDMVITGGENVYSVEVEAVLLLHPSVAEAAVVGVPDERFGEALVAVVACRAGCSLDLDELIAHCRSRIGGYKIPRRLHQVAALPRSALGKVLKADLRRKVAAGQ